MEVINNKLIKTPRELRDILRFRLWFFRDDKNTSIENTPELSPYTNGLTWLALNQAPCATTIKGGPKTFLKGNQALAREVGIGLTSEATLTGESLLNRIVAEGDSPETSFDEGGFTEVKSGISKKIRVDYLDPWKVLAARELCAVLKTNERPVLRIWYADIYRISDPIPASLLGPSYKAGFRNKSKVPRPILLHKVKNTESILYFIFHHTHWGYKLQRLCEPKANSNRTHAWATLLRKRIKSFIEGKPDPAWSDSQVNLFYDDKSLRKTESRVLRLQELIKTVSGMFVQRYLALPEEVWTWEKFDIYNLKNLSYLLSDEFFDGQCTEHILTIKTYYKSLKEMRKSFKLLAMTGKEPDISLLPDWLRMEFTVWKTVLDRQFCEHKAYQIAILSQSRGCGTPPLIDELLSKKKFIDTVTDPVTPLGREKRDWIRRGLEAVLRDVPDQAFTGLSTKACVTVTTSSCIERTVKEGGTTQAISDELLAYCPAKIPITDLFTGKVSKWVNKSDLDIGEVIFWHSLKRVLETNPVELRKVSLLVVKEPGKARCVTKGLSYLKVVLDVVNKICSYPLKKGIESSTSGMSMENHGWEFFKSFFGNKEPNLFELEHKAKSEEKGLRSLDVIETYKDVFVSSTDYVTATDWELFEVVHLISDSWMRKCGIPPILRGIVIETCYKPRTILFKATGPLKSLGSPTAEDETLHTVTSCRGVLMGDPLTKPCLHLINVLARTIAKIMVDQGNDPLR